MAKNCKQPKKEKKSQGYFKYSKKGHIAIGYRASQQIKIRSSQQENSDNEKQKSFVEDLK